MGSQYTGKIPEWCAEAQFSTALYYKRKRQGLGPKEAHVGKRVVIIELPREYLSRCSELEAASAPRIAETV